MDIQDRLSELEWNNDFTPLKKDGKTKSNYERKRRRGVRGYTYTVTMKGIKYALGRSHVEYEVPYL